MNCSCSHCGNNHRSGAPRVYDSASVISAFKKAAAFHLRLMDVVNIEKPSLVSIPDWTNPKGNFEGRVLVAGSLRKFALNKSDDVYLPRALECALFEAGWPDSSIAEARNSLERNIVVANHGNQDLTARTSGGRPHRLDANSLVSDLLYGFYLHGDPTRQTAFHEIGSDATHAALAQWIFTINNLLSKTYKKVSDLHPDD